MKKSITEKLLGFIKQWLLPRLARRLRGDKSKASELNRRKKLSPNHEHLLRVAQIFKNRFRQKA